MKEYIKNKLNEQFKVYQKVDYSLNNKHNDELKRKYVCNVLSVKTIEEGIDLLNKAIGTKSQNPEDWNKIQKPMKMWSDITKQLREELKTGMTGDSEVDESNTWWSAIQSTFCK